MQVMHYHFMEGENPRDMQTNLNVGARVLSQNLVLTGGNVRMALAAYNCGPNGDYATDPDCQLYATEVLAYYKLYVGHAYPNPDGSPET